MPHLKPSLPFKIIFATLFAAIIIGTVYGTMMYAVVQSDRSTVERQDSLLALVVGKMQESIAHDQESATVWDDAVTHVAAGDRDWMAANLGRWMNSYFGHDAAFVLGPTDQLAYGYSATEANDQVAFAFVAADALKLVKKLRKRLADGDTAGVSDKSLTIGESDIVKIRDRPAILSVKPIVSDSGEIAVDEQHQFVHIALRYLDGDFAHTLASEYLFNDLRFEWKKDGQAGRSVFPLASRSGQVFGYFSWVPFRPGTEVLRATEPVLAVGGLLVLAAMSAFVLLLQGRSSRLRESQSRLQHLAHHDVLSGLPNRAAFNAAVEETLAKSQAAVLFVDLDRFKNVNDTLGHPVGDKLIAEVGSRLRSAAGTGVLVARIGGDEFTIIIPDPKMNLVEKLAENIVAAIRSPFEIDGQPILIGASIGIAVSSSGSDAQDLVRRADIALYHAKEAGRNQFAIFGQHMDDLIRTRRDLERDLRTALQTGDEIAVHYQPIYASNARLIGVEALTRWRHPTRGLVQPETFISIAEEAGLIDRLGEIVMSTALTDAKKWPELIVAVNASPVELRSETYALRVIGLLDKFDFDPRQLEIEITESAVLENEEACRRNIRALREIGVQFALDDFGTGFSSFGRLQKLDVDRIKIDRCFVGEYGKPGSNAGIVQAMIELAHAGGMRATAEGVETPEQQAWLIDAGCDELQGFFLSRPVVASEIERLRSGAFREGGAAAS
ncbi:EAL domain-containing protein [Rhizobium sp. BG4]|uniref:putative bifunctional diguanylate cyclase/phosphodiesterase n=1 Tax=Rhizobium sp. BG4 TaxID=2613770 RepID=UPI00193E5C2C|nr:EAL domain-containing protein [Rhizobium sp. BG4]QRM47597.1 EAL domain-containing protein [Rhizobium sp. BG4]